MRRNKFSKAIITAILAVLLTVGGLSAVDFSSFKLSFDTAKWHLIYNAFVTAVQTEITALATVVSNWVGVQSYQTATYSTASQFTVPGNLTAKYAPGRWLLIDQGVDGPFCNTVVTSSYGGGVTTVNVTTANLTVNLVRVQVLTPTQSDVVVAAEYGSDQAALQAADIVAAAADKELDVTGAWTLASAYTFTAAVNIRTGATLAINDDILFSKSSKVSPWALLSVATTKTLTFTYPPEAGLYHIFSCAGTGKVVLPATATAYPVWWGISGGTSNDSAAVNAALASGASIIDIGSFIYLINDSINWDLSKCVMWGNGAKFDATGNPGVAINIFNGNSTPGVPYSWSNSRNRGFEIEGDKIANPSSVGLEINGSYEISGFRLYNVAIHGFNIALNLDLPSYIYASSFNECAFYDSVYAVKVTHGGETTTFNNCLMFNSTYGFYAGDGGGFRLLGCHINYNDQAVYAAGSARVALDNPFIEANADTDYWIICSGNSTGVILKGGIIVNTCPTPKTYNVGLADLCGAEGIVLDGTLLSAFTAANYGVSDIIKVTDYTGAVQFRGVRPFIVSDGLPTVATSRLMLSSHSNYLRDGGFETAYTTDWTATGGAGYVVPTLDAAEHHGGAKSLKFAPAAGNVTKVARTIPCRVGEWGRMSFWVKNDLATSVDPFYIVAGYAAADGSEIAGYTNMITLSQAGTHYDTWTQLWITPYSPAPAGAVSIVFTLMHGNSDGNGETWVDDVQINMWIQ